MSSTHRKKLARRLAEVAGIGYQKALAVVVEAAEAGLLPSTLDEAGVEAAVRILTAADVPDVTKLDGTGLLRLVIEEALLAGATDIHFTSQPDAFDVWTRANGTMSQLGSYPVETGRLLLSKVKLDAGMRVDNLAEPESGALRYQLSEDRTVSLRVETFPTQAGPAAVMRIVGPYAALTIYGKGWSGLGFSAADQAKLSELTDRPNGLVLVTGPVGCGKTVTTYEFVRQHSDAGRRVITLEDPIEHLFEHPLVEQVQPDRDSTLTRAAQARVLMRRDPNTFVLGEIRDISDAQAVVGIAETGTFCIATMHASNPAHTIARMMHTLPDGHEDAFASTLTAVISQLLVPVDGRRQLRAEVLIVTDEIRDLIRAKVTDVAVLEAAMERAGVVVTDDGPSGRPGVLPKLPDGREEGSPAKAAASTSPEARLIIERTFAPAADLVDLGSSVPDALEVMAAEYAGRPDLNIEPVLTSLVTAMRGDRSMTSAMSETGAFSPWAVRAIELGERSGRVSEALRTVARRTV